MSHRVPAPLHPRFAVLAAFALILIAGQPARADLGLTFTAEDVSAGPGTTGNALDITLTNNSTSSTFSIGGFTFQLTAASSDIIFTDANTSTTAAAYIFSGHTYYGPDITITASGSTISADDFYNPLTGTITLKPGDTVGLGHVLFDVAATAMNGQVAVQFSGGIANNLTDGGFQNIPVTTLSDGSIMVSTMSPQAVPEPSSLAVTVGISALAGLGYALKKGTRTVFRSASKSPSRP